jgi:hypothetical protein
MIGLLFAVLLASLENIEVTGHRLQNHLPHCSNVSCKQALRLASISAGERFWPI